MQRLRLRRSLDWVEIGAAFREGAPLGFLYAAESGAMAVGTMVIGTFGTIALAANQVVSSVGGLLYMVPLGFAGAVALRVAQESGAGNEEGRRATVWTALVMTTGWLSVAVGGAGVRRARRSRGRSRAIRRWWRLRRSFSSRLRRCSCRTGCSRRCWGRCGGMSDTVWPAMVSIVAYWGVALPLGWVLAYPLGFGPVAIWLGFGIGLSVAGVALTARFRWQTS